MVQSYQKGGKRTKTRAREALVRYVDYKKIVILRKRLIFSQTNYFL